MIHLWRGHHHPDLLPLLKRAWKDDDLVILVPHHQRDFSFMQSFGGEEVVCYGDWPSDLRKPSIGDGRPAAREILDRAVLGVFTSGTTSGLGRLVLYSKENILSSLTAIRSLFEVEKIKSIFCYPQPTHTFGLVLGYMHAALFDLELYFSQGAYSKSAHDEWGQRVNGGMLTLGTPTHFLDLLQWVSRTEFNPMPSYTSIVGGAPATCSLWSAMQNRLRIDSPSVGYGATEASPGVTHLPPGVPPIADGDVGFALPGVQINANAQLGLDFSGKNVCLAILEDGELRPQTNITLKDHLHIDSNGAHPRYIFVGRTDSLVNRGGVKFSLESLEAKVATHFQCRALAMKIFDERLGEDIGLIVNADNDVENFLETEMGLKLNEKNVLVAEIPLSPNGKFDRKEALKMILRSKNLQPPIAIAHLQDFLPHRAPAIWVDRLVETQKHFGICEIVIDPGKNYFSPGGFRQTACIEFVAQTYGYTAAMNEVLLLQTEKPPNRVFIVEVKSCEFTMEDTNLKAGDIVRAEAKCTHDFGSLKVVQGTVKLGEKSLARMSLKLYCGH